MFPLPLSDSQKSFSLPLPLSLVSSSGAQPFGTSRRNSRSKNKTDRNSKEPSPNLRQQANSKEISGRGSSKRPQNQQNQPGHFLGHLKKETVQQNIDFINLMYDQTENNHRSISKKKEKKKAVMNDLEEEQPIPAAPVPFLQSPTHNSSRSNPKIPKTIRETKKESNTGNYESYMSNQRKPTNNYGEIPRCHDGNSRPKPTIELREDSDQDDFKSRNDFINGTFGKPKRTQEEMEHRLAKNEGGNGSKEEMTMSWRESFKERIRRMKGEFQGELFETMKEESASEKYKKKMEEIMESLKEGTSLSEKQLESSSFIQEKEKEKTTKNEKVKEPQKKEMNLKEKEKHKGIIGDKENEEALKEPKKLRDSRKNSGLGQVWAKKSTLNERKENLGENKKRSDDMEGETKGKWSTREKSLKAVQNNKKGPSKYSVFTGKCLF